MSSREDDDSDAALLAQMREGLEHAFVALYRRRRPGVFRVAWHMSGSRSIAEEVTQEVFLALVRDGHRIDLTRGTVASWLYGVTRNHVNRHLREPATLPLDEDERWIDRAAEATDPLAGLARRRDVERVRSAIRELPAHYRDVVVLCELAGLDYADTAKALECPIGTVRSRLARGRALLAERLREASESPGRALAQPARVAP